MVELLAAVSVLVLGAIALGVAALFFVLAYREPERVAVMVGSLHVAIGIAALVGFAVRTRWAIGALGILVLVEALLRRPLLRRLAKPST